jgi:hypothetical protein
VTRTGAFRAPDTRGSTIVRMDESQPGTVGTLGRRLVAWIVLLAAGLLVLKLLVGFVIGILQAVMIIVLLAVAAVGVLWALRHL